MIICAGCLRSTGGHTFACCGMGFCAVCYYDAHFVQHVLAGATMPPARPSAPSMRMVSEGPRFAWWLPLIVFALLAGAAFADAPAPVPRPPAVATPQPSPTPEPFDLENPPTDPPEPLPPPPPVVVPSPAPPTSVEKANARGFHADSQLGALGTMTAADGTEVSPMFWIQTDGPIALGSRSIGRLGARLGLTSSPGTTFNALDVHTYNAIEADFWGGYVVGAFKAVETTVFVEGGFASRMKGEVDPQPLRRLVRSAGIGIRFDARRSNANFVAKGGFDEATTSCLPPQGAFNGPNCYGFHSGFALMLRGQVPIYKGAALLTGDVSLSIGGSASWLERRDILRVGLVLDPVETVKVIRGSK